MSDERTVFGLDARPMGVSRTHIAAASGIILAAALAEYLMGHPLICKCGYVKLWHFDVQSAENSQHLIETGTRRRTSSTASCSTGCSG
jgi:hypothetical protein